MDLNSFLDKKLRFYQHHRTEKKNNHKL